MWRVAKQLRAVHEVVVRRQEGEKDPEVVWLDEGEESVKEMLRTGEGVRVEPLMKWSNSMVQEPKVELWEFEGKEDLKGWHIETEERRVLIADLMLEASKLEAEGKEVVLHTYSDAGLKEAGAGSVAAYGWMIGGIAGGKHRTNLTGGGPVKGAPENLTSTRAKHVGLLVTVIAVVEMGWRWKMEHKLDNQGSWTLVAGYAEDDGSARLAQCSGS